jgi:hypothetical protein
MIGDIEQKESSKLKFDHKDLHIRRFSDLYNEHP